MFTSKLNALARHKVQVDHLAIPDLGHRAAKFSIDSIWERFAFLNIFVSLYSFPRERKIARYSRICSYTRTGMASVFLEGDLLVTRVILFFEVTHGLALGSPD